MRRNALLLLLLIALFCVGCGKKKEEVSHRFNGLEICFKEQVTSIDPRIGTARPSNSVVSMLFEGLMSADIDGNLTLALAEKYEISEDLQTYTFYIRPCHWSNGDPISAYDFEYAWKRSINPLTAQPSGHAFYPIKNASKCLEGKSKIEEVGITAVNNRILVVELEHPAPYFLELVSTSLFSPIPKDIVLKNSDWANQSSDKFISSGPFRLRKWKRGQFLQMDRNPFYWNADEVHISEIMIKILPDEYDRLRLFEENKTDWIGQPVAPFSSELVGELHYVEHQPSLGLLAYFCNVESYPFNNTNLRKALAYSIDRKTIADHIFYEGATPALSLLNPLLNGQKQSTYFHEEHEGAKAALYLRIALTELGMDLGDLPELVLSYPNTSLQSRVAQVIQKQWKDHLGLVVRLDPLDKPRFFDQVKKGQHQIASCMWKGLLLDSSHFLETMGSTLGMNILTHWRAPEFLKIIEQLRTETNPSKKGNLISKAEHFLMEEMPIIPICFGSVCFLKSERLKDVYVSPLYRVDFKHAYLIDDEMKVIR